MKNHKGFQFAIYFYTIIISLFCTTTLHAEDNDNSSEESAMAEIIHNQGLPNSFVSDLINSPPTASTFAGDINDPDFQEMLDLQTNSDTDLQNKLTYKTTHRPATTAAGTVSVNTWNAFCTQVKNPKVQTIILTNNLVASTQSAHVTSDKTIDFNNYQINTADCTISLDQGTTTVKDAYVTATTTDSKMYYSFTATGGNLIVQDTSINNATTSADINNATTNSTISNGGFYSAEAATAPVAITFDHANVAQQMPASITTSSASNTSAYAIVLNSSVGSQLNVNSSKLQVKANNYLIFPGMSKNLSVDKSISINNSTINAVQASTSYTNYDNFFINGDNKNTYAGLNLNIIDHSQIKVNYSNNNDLNSSGVIRLYGTGSLLKMASGSGLDIKNINGPAVSISGTDSKFEVTGTKDDKTTSLNITRGTGSGGVSLNPAVRFILTGGMLFDMQGNVKVNVYQNTQSSNAPGIRMYGSGNQVSVSQGAEFNLHNNSTAGSPGTGDIGGEGILYTGSAGGSKDNSFTLRDPDSQVLVDANNGPAITSPSIPLKIDAGVSSNDSISFVARGNYPKNAIFSANSNDLNFNMPYPRYFDFQNRAPSGSNSYLFNGAKTSLFNHNALPLQVWDNNSDVNGNPSGNWAHVGATYQSSSASSTFDTVVPSSDSDPSDASNFKQYLDTPLGSAKGLTKIIRMTANVTPGKVSWLQDQNNQFITPANTDKYIWLQAQVPAENSAFRPALDNEIHADLQVTLPDGTVQELHGLSSTQETYYDNTNLKGAIKVAAPDLNLLPTGTKIKILRVWRNGTYENGKYSSSAIVSEPQKDFDDSEKVVINKTPPAPAKVFHAQSTLTDHHSTTALSTIVPSTTNLSGTGAANTQVSWRVLNADGSIHYESTPAENTTVDSSGQWSLTKIHGLSSGQKLQVVLTDTDQNSNPQVTTAYHDTTFPAATTLNVKGDLTMQVPSSLDFGTHMSADRKNLPMKTITGNLAVTDTDHQETNWMVAVQLANQLDDDLGTGNLPLYYGNNGLSTQITATPTMIFQKNAPDPNDNILDISQTWTTSANSSAATPQGPFLKNTNATPTLPNTNHHGHLTWTLTNSLN